LFLLIAVGNRISTPLKPGDAEVAQMRIAQTPLAAQTTELKFAEPTSDAWKRLSKAWGEPAYVVTVELARNEQGCWEDFHLDTESTVAFEADSQPLFGHLNECGNGYLGLKFRSPAAEFRFTAPEHAKFPPADLVILPVWPGDMKRHLGEAYVDEELAGVSRWLMGIGAILALVGAAGMWGRGRSTSLTATSSSGGL
jgi:hypothetical protein